MLSIAARLTLLATQLRTAIGRFVVRESRATSLVWLGTTAYTAKPQPGQLPKLPPAVWGLFVDRLARLASRFETLFNRWRSNTLPKPRPPRSRAAARAETPVQAPPPALPRAQGWVNRRIPEAAPPAGQFDALLHDPQTRAFVQAAPQAGRLLRPLCRALGIKQPGWLRLPKPRCPPRPAPRAAPRPASLRAIQQSDRPLQPYVLAATRAWRPKFG